MTRQQALKLGSPALLALLGCLVWAAYDWILHRDDWPH